MENVVIPQMFDIQETDDRLVFGKEPAWPSQNTLVQFTLEDGNIRIPFSCVKQALLYKKAVLFNKPKLIQRIVHAENSKCYRFITKKLNHCCAHQEQLKQAWQTCKFEIMVEVNYAKYSQNPLFGQRLLETDNKLLVKAIKHDRIEGVGVDIDTALDVAPSELGGENLLGKVLMAVRDKLRQQKTREEDECKQKTKQPTKEITAVDST